MEVQSYLRLMLSSLFSSVFSESENYFIYINQSIKLSELVLSSHNKAEPPQSFQKESFFLSLSLGTLAGRARPVKPAHPIRGHILCN